MYSFTLDGIRSEDKGIIVNNVERNILPKITSKTIDITDMDGAFYYKSKFEMRIITFTISILSDTFYTNQIMIRTIADYLNPNIGQRQLILDDENDKYYTAVLTEDSNVTQIIKLKQGTISFLIVSPFAKSINSEIISVKKITTTFERSSSAYDGQISVGTNVARYTDGLNLEIGTTNLIAVSNFESGTDSWNFTTNIVIASKSDISYIGNKSLKIIFVPSGGIYKDYFATFVVGTNYTFSGWIYANDYMVGKYIQFGVEQRGGSNPNNYIYSNFVLINGWQFFSYSFVVDYSDRTAMRLSIYGSSSFQNGDVLYFDAPQLESKSYSTSYTLGTRVYERAYLPIASSGINFNTGTIEFYLNKMDVAGTFSGLMEIGAYSSPITLDRFVIFNGTSFLDGEKRFAFQVTNGSTTEQNTVSAILNNRPVSGQNYYLCIRWDLSTIIKIDVYDYTNLDYKIGSTNISMSTPSFSLYTNIYLGLLTNTFNSNWKIRAIKFSNGIKSDDDVLNSIENGYDNFNSDYQTTYLCNFINGTLNNTSFTRVGTANCTMQIKVFFNASVSEYKITQISSGYYVRVINEFVSGDILLINGNENKVYINNVLAMDKLDINSIFFLLDEVECIFTIDQYSSTETTIIYVPTWL